MNQKKTDRLGQTNPHEDMKKVARRSSRFASSKASHEKSSGGSDRELQRYALVGHELLADDESDSLNGNLDEFEPRWVASRHEVSRCGAPYFLDPAHLTKTAKRSVQFRQQDIQRSGSHYHLETVAAER